MKLLIYGIDGGDLAVMKKFPMPFLRRFLAKNESVELTSDLIHRGWAEILTGKGGEHTGAFYMAPALDGTHKCSTTFRMNMLDRRTDIKPMWRLFEEAHLPFLIMNVPTTTPVPKVTNGIVIGSAGGGLNKIEGIPDDLMSDPSVRETLDRHQYIVDIRIPTRDYTQTVDLLDDLVRMEERRTQAFIDLCQQRHIEAAFLVNRGTTIIEYLARSEIESYEAGQVMGEFMPRAQPLSWIHRKLEEHFAMLDAQLQLLYETLRPDHFIITADHGSVPHKYRANVNPFLEAAGYLRRKRSSGLIASLRAFKNRLGLQKASSRLMKNVPKAYDALAAFDWGGSVAFGHTYIPGIFINDAARFQGPVKERQISGLVDEILAAFNALDAAERNNMIAEPYRCRFEGAAAAKLPDIKLAGSEGVFFDDAVRGLAVRNPCYGPVPTDLETVRHAAFTGDKGPHPVCVMTQRTAKLVAPNDPRDLTLIYRLVEKACACES
jgi:predicted AlkP superfamily phosphohydrolase/phosphomutase